MATERRNLYRLLYVQPEAPPEIIKASFRTLMGTLRGHPDLGGDAEQAARVIAAYAVLGDAEKRRAYDLSRRRPGRGADGGRAGSSVSAAPPAAPAPPARASTASTASTSSTAATSSPAPAAPAAWAPSAAADRPAPAGALADPGRWLVDRRCPFCCLSFVGMPVRDQRCGRCRSPLAPAPTAERSPGELLGRRHGERIARELDAVLHLPGRPGEIAARLRDVSFTGLSIVCTPRVARHTALRVVTAGFDAVALAIACRASGPLHTVHAHLLTLRLRSGGRGALVSTRA